MAENEFRKIMFDELKKIRDHNKYKNRYYLPPNTDIDLHKELLRQRGEAFRVDKVFRETDGFFMGYEVKIYQR
jgi:hypothetical protein